MNRRALFVTLVPLFGIAYFLYFFANPPWTPLRITGLVLLIPSLILVTVVRFQLGNSFSIAPEARALVTHGLYSRIRNPVYVFGTLVILGLPLHQQTPLPFHLPRHHSPPNLPRPRRSPRPRSPLRRRLPPLQIPNLVLNGDTLAVICVEAKAPGKGRSTGNQP